MNLTKTEEQLMQYLWVLKKAFMKDLLDAYPEPKPATTTIATLLKRMIDKDFVAYERLGNSRQYYPLVSKRDYFSRHLKGMIKNFFDDSPAQFASFFTEDVDLSKEELAELRAMIDNKLKDE
ncbi:MAG TPA: penicillinase repressor [Cytophagales bacterium]|nr:penicillinase repressor [Cytophagales bacterium]HAA22058.1 penicillinase repressor [Cytophagales bacterium]HAP60806.1 penicillinase repressor [Cytophagales bacterium]